MARIARLLPLTLVLISFACGGENPAGPPAVTSVVVTPGADTLLTLGRTRQFTAVARDANGNPVSGVTLAWSSSNPSVATVDAATGIVTAVGNGLSVIRADAGGVQGQATLAVAQVVATVVVSPPSAGFTAVGDTQRLAAAAKDSSGAIVQGVRFLWQSSDQAVVTVDTGGLLRSRGPGSTFITAAGRGVPGHAVITVTQAAARLVFVGALPGIVAGDLIPFAVQVEVRDSNDALIAGARNAITIALDSGAAGTLVGTRTVGAVGGVATFTGLTYNGFSGPHTLKATASGVGNGESPSFAVAPAATATITSLGTGVDGIVGDPLPAWAFELRDRFGNLTDMPDTVRLSVAVSPWGSHVVGQTAVIPVNGVATFSGFWMDRPGAGVRLKATQGSVSSPASASAFTDTLPPIAGASQGGNHACAVASSLGRVFCWGLNDFGELGNGTLLSDSVPVLVKSTADFLVVTVGSAKSCALAAGGVPYCWGEVAGTTVMQRVPTLVPGGLTFTKIRAGDAHVCGLTGAGAIYCWGDNQSGQLGDGFVHGLSVTTPAPITSALTFTDVSAGGPTTCAVATGGAAYCWGNGYFGGLGTGSTASDSVPTLVQGGLSFARLAVATDHTCGLTTDSLAYCWGANDGGQLGDSTLNADSVPVAVFGGLKFVSIAAGWGYSCGLNTAQHVLCWGNASLSPYDIAPVDMGFTADVILPGIGNGCILSAKRLQCWGLNTQFQLGDGTRDFGTFPHPIVAQTRRQP